MIEIWFLIQGSRFKVHGCLVAGGRSRKLAILSLAINPLKSMFHPDLSEILIRQLAKKDLPNSKHRYPHIQFHRLSVEGILR